MTPFLAVFLGEHFTREQPMAHWDIASIAEETMLEVRAPRATERATRMHALYLQAAAARQ